MELSGTFLTDGSTSITDFAVHGFYYREKYISFALQIIYAIPKKK